jgi:hypothetical protein
MGCTKEKLLPMDRVSTHKHVSGETGGARRREKWKRQERPDAEDPGAPGPAAPARAAPGGPALRAARRPVAVDAADYFGS